MPAAPGLLRLRLAMTRWKHPSEVPHGRRSGLAPSGRFGFDRKGSRRPGCPVRPEAVRDEVAKHVGRFKTRTSAASRDNAFPLENLHDFGVEVPPVPSPGGRGTRVRGGAPSGRHVGATLVVRTPSPPPSPPGRGSYRAPGERSGFDRKDSRRPSCPVRQAAVRDEVAKHVRRFRARTPTPSWDNAFPLGSLREFGVELPPVPSPVPALCETAPSPGRLRRPPSPARGEGSPCPLLRNASPPHGPALPPRGRGRRGGAEPGEGASAEVSHGRGGCSCPWQRLRFGRGDQRRQFAEVSHGRGSYRAPTGRFGFTGSGRFAPPQRPATALHRIADHISPRWRRSHGGRDVFASPGINTVGACCSKYLSLAERHRGEGMCPSMTPQSLTPTHPHDRSALAPRPECRPAPRERAPASLIASSQADHV